MFYGENRKEETLLDISNIPPEGAEGCIFFKPKKPLFPGLTQRNGMDKVSFPLSIPVLTGSIQSFKKRERERMCDLSLQLTNSPSMCHVVFFISVGTIGIAVDRLCRVLMTDESLNGKLREYTYVCSAGMFSVLNMY